MLESTPRSTLYHVYNRRYKRSCKKVFDLDFQGHAMKIEFFSLSRLDSVTPKTYPREIFLKNSDGKTEIQGGGTHPPWASEVGFSPWASASLNERKNEHNRLFVSLSVIRLFLH